MSSVGSNFHCCVSRFNFCSLLLFNRCINVSNTIRQHYLFDRDQKRVSLAQFLHDSLSLRDAAHQFPCLFDKWRNFVHYKLVSNWLIMLLFFYSLLVLCV